MSKLLIDESATITLAENLYNAMPEDKAGWTILLTGELGAGKSTFARAFINFAGHNGPVPSPTYTLIEPYDLPSGMIYHIDLYRVIDSEELRYLGWGELDHGFCLVEWPDRAPDLAANADLNVEIHYEGDSRRVFIHGLSERGSFVIQEIN